MEFDHNDIIPGDVAFCFYGKTTTPAAFSHVTVFFRQKPIHDVLMLYRRRRGAYNDDVHISNAVTTP